MSISLQRIKELVVDWGHKEIVELEEFLGMHPNRAKPTPAPISDSAAVVDSPAAPAPEEKPGEPTTASVTAAEPEAYVAMTSGTGTEPTQAEEPADGQQV